jgi:hypothetical protein
VVEREHNYLMNPAHKDFNLGKLCTGHDADELQVLEHESGG